MNKWEYGIPNEDEVQATGELLAQALHFNMGAEQIAQWTERVGREAFRIVRQNGKPAAGLRIHRMGQWFGGRNAPVAGIGAVGVAPEARGSGLGRELMRRMHAEMQSEGVPLSVLFPATTSFYRSVGYERAGLWNTYEIAPDAIRLRDREAEVVRLEDPYLPKLKSIYEQRARLTNGNLDRSPFIWMRAAEPQGKQALRYLITHQGEAEGYVVFFQHGQHEPIQITDQCTLTARAARRLLTFLADHNTLVDKIRWYGGPQDPMLFLLPEQSAKQTNALEWVVRILDAERALMARGYPELLTGELHLAVEDNELAVNQDRFVLTLEHGDATVQRGGAGDLSTSIRGLAALYTGRLTAAELRAGGLLDGTSRALQFADLLFSGPRPWMPDIF